MLYENVLNFVIFLRKHNIFTFNYYTRRDILYINSVMYGCNLFLVLLTNDLLSIHLDWPKEKNINKSITNIRKKYKTLKTLKNVILWNLKKKTYQYYFETNNSQWIISSFYTNFSFQSITQLDWMDRNGLNGLNWTKIVPIDRSRLRWTKWTELDRSGLNGQKWS